MNTANTDNLFSDLTAQESATVAGGHCYRRYGGYGGYYGGGYGGGYDGYYRPTAYYYRPYSYRRCYRYYGGYDW